MPREPDFDESADMRLVELQRAALGVKRPELGAWKTPVSLEGAPVDASPAQPPQSAVVSIELRANPPAGVIPGAVVTLALSAVNDGVSAARTLRLAVPLPGGVTYRNGSLLRDGRPLPDSAADELFGSGMLVAELPSKTRLTLLWKIGVRIGNKPLVIAVNASAEEGAVVGAGAVSISRRESAPGGFASAVEQYVRSAPFEVDEPDLPIYELDAEEEIVQTAAEAALSEYRSPMSPPGPAAPPPSQPEPAPPPDQPDPGQEPAVPVPEPYNPEPPSEPPAVEPAAREAVVLYGRLDRPSIAYFERTFSGSKPPTLLNHFILGGALACTRDAQGNDAAGLGAHMQAQGQLLQRAVLHEKLGKKEPIGQYAGTMLARIDELSPVPVRDPRNGDRSAVLLAAEIDEPNLAVFRAVQTDPSRFDFTAARRLTLAFQGRRIAAPRAAGAERAEAALGEYARIAATHLQRFFVRMRLDRTTGLLFSRDETLDAAAQRLIAALIALFG